MSHPFEYHSGIGDEMLYLTKDGIFFKFKVWPKSKFISQVGELKKYNYVIECLRNIFYQILKKVVIISPIIEEWLPRYEEPHTIYIS